jgi:hypothetical protein
MKSDVALVAKAESFSSRIAGRAQEQDDQPQNVRLLRQSLGQLRHVFIMPSRPASTRVRYGISRGANYCKP